LEEEKDIKQEFLDKIRDSLDSNTFVKLTLSKFRGKEQGLENIYLQPVKIHNEVALSFRYKYKTKDIFKNYDFDESITQLSEHIGSDFLFASLYTTKQDIVIEYNKKREPRTYTRKASITRVDIKQHNRIKARFVDSKEKYLNMLGITNQKGEVKAEKSDKFRQIDKFIEIVDSLYKDSSLADKNEISIVDFGSGKSYLTFALYDYFTNRIGIDAKIIGVEQREELVKNVNNIVAECKFKKLSFVSGSIYDFKLKNADIVAALHACDIATDDAIAKALKLNAEIIILAPCCQKYVRRQIEIPEKLYGVFKHGILEEHLSSFVTDGLRALVLEAYGYKTKVFEFVSPEHTGKNIMITAVKDEYNEEKYFEKVVEIEKLKSEFGLKDFYLDKILSNVKN
jgi:hypothetical protein